MLGLSRQQVTVPNFGTHTINAIKDIKKRSEELSTDAAFEMVQGKSSIDTKEFMKFYLSSTKKVQKPIDEMDLIRVVVNTGGGFGHQRAAITLMQKLREMGFRGTFDIKCDDRLDAELFNSKYGKMYTNKEPLVSGRLIDMLPGLESSKTKVGGVRVVKGLGAVKISSLPYNYSRRGDLELSEADLAVCAADDSILAVENTNAKTFNARSYIGLQPTDWHKGFCFVTDQDGVVTRLFPASTMRLSSLAASQLPDISSVLLSATEQRVLSITSGSEFNSQLVYGLHPAWAFSIETRSVKETANLNEATEMQRIVEANFLLSKKTGKPSLLLLPQKVALKYDFIWVVKGEAENVHFINLTRDDVDMAVYNAGDVVVAYTGCLQQTVFDHLMLQGTTLPPVIEGCNARETCESAGRPFIHGSGKYDHLKQYDVQSGCKQKLHAQASLCLEQGGQEYVPQLVQYMEESLESNRELMTYHAQRREAFLARPDACEVAFDALGIKYEKCLGQKVGETKVCAR